MAHRGHPETGCPIPSLSSELGHLSEDGRGRLSRGMRGLVDGLTRLLERGGIGDPAEEANAALSDALGALALARLKTGPQAAETIPQKARNTVTYRYGVPYMNPKPPPRHRPRANVRERTKRA